MFLAAVIRVFINQRHRRKRVNFFAHDYGVSVIRIFFE